MAELAIVGLALAAPSMVDLMIKFGKELAERIKSC
jgi:hypothetical protein